MEPSSTLRHCQVQPGLTFTLPDALYQLSTSWAVFRKSRVAASRHCSARRLLRLTASPTYETASYATVRRRARVGSIAARSDCVGKHLDRHGLGNDCTRQTPGHAHRGRARHGPFSAGHPTPSWLSRWFWRLSWTCLGCLVGVGTLTGTRASRNRAAWSRPRRAPSSVCCSLELHDIGLLLGACCLGWLGERTQVHSHHSAPACGGCWFWPFLVAGSLLRQDTGQLLNGFPRRLVGWLCAGPLACGH